MTKSLNSLDREPLLNRRIMLAGAVLATAGVAGSWLYSAILAPRRDTVAKAQAKRRTAKLPPEELVNPGPFPDLVIGKADAPITIIEYADLACPACANFHSKVLPALSEKYIDKGHVRLVFREFPTNTLSIIATMTARCVEPGRALPLISALFSRQEDWLRAKSIDELRGKLFTLSQQVGLTRQAFNACVPAGETLSSQQQKLLKDIKTSYERAHHGFGVSTTPTFFVNGTKIAGATIEDFDKAIAPLLNK